MTISIGKVIEDTDNIGHRDAIHSQCVLVTRDFYYDGPGPTHLEPGTSVKFTSSDYDKVVPCYRDERHGIVDPWIDPGINLHQDRSFWVFLKPGITSDPIHVFDIDIEDQDPDGIGCGTYCG